MWTDQKIRGFKPRDKRYRVSDDLGQRGVGKLVLDIQPNGVKTFFFQYYRKEAGASKRVLINIGSYKSRGSISGLSLSEAREQALELSKKSLSGDVKKQLKQDVQKQEAAEKLELIAAITLSDAFEGYLDNKDLKAGTVFDYRRSIKYTFSEYLDQPITNIDREIILDLYRQKTKKSVARTNNSMRVFRAVYNYQRAVTRLTSGEYILPDNPYDILREARVIRKLPRRQSYIPREDLKNWFEVVMSLDDSRFNSGSTIRDFLIFLLLTGTRRDEARTIRKDQVNLRRGVFKLTDTKNREVVELPMSNYHHELVAKRVRENKGDYLFSGLDPNKPIVSFKRPLEYFREDHNLHFTMHDLRRTFITIAESLDISSYTIKRLVNHKLDSSNDVTAGYIIIDLERMKIATQRITNAILKLAEHKNSLSPDQNNLTTSVQP